MTAESTASEARPGGIANWPALIVVAFVFVLFAVLLNSVGPVILQSILSFNVEKTEAGLLEGFKDLSIAAASFFAAIVLHMIGFRRGAAISLLAVAAACFAVPLVSEFWVLKLQFAVVGIAFAMIKTSVYVIIGLVSRDSKSHASTTSVLEGVFMIGVLSSFWLFSAFIDPANPAATSWVDVYWWLGAAAILASVMIVFVPLDERPARDERASAGKTALGMGRLLARPLVLIFLACAFLDVLVEQSINSWLPAFNHEVLKMPPTLAVQLASLYATGVAAGRLGFGLALQKVPWVWMLCGGLVLSGVILALAVPLAGQSPATADTSWTNLPLAAYAVPAVGLLLGPIYPVLCSTVLSSLPTQSHSAMTGLILISSALGGTIGSFITGRLFAVLSGEIAFAAIIPFMAALAVVIVAFNAATKRTASVGGTAPHA